MAKKAKAAVEGEVVEPSAPEEETTKEEIVETVEDNLIDEIAEEITDEIIEEATAPSEDLVTIKLLMTGPIRGADGNKIHQGRTGEVVSHQADAMVGRGQAELV